MTIGARCKIQLSALSGSLTGRKIHWNRLGDNMIDVDKLLVETAKELGRATAIGEIVEHVKHLPRLEMEGKQYMLCDDVFAMLAREIFKDKQS